MEEKDKSDKVYVVTYGHFYESTYVLGVFISDKLARKAIIDQGLLEYDFAEVEEFEVQK